MKREADKHTVIRFSSIVFFQKMLFSKSILVTLVAIVGSSFLDDAVVGVKGQQVQQVCENHDDCNANGSGGSDFCEETYDLDTSSTVNKCSACGPNCYVVDRTWNSSIAATYGCPQTCCDWDLPILDTYSSPYWLETWTIAPCDTATTKSKTFFAGWIVGADAVSKSVEDFASESEPCAVVTYNYDDGKFPEVAYVIDCTEADDEDTDDDVCVTEERTYGIWMVDEESGDMEFYKDTPTVIKFGLEDLCDFLEDTGKAIARGFIITIVIIVLLVLACIGACVYCCVRKNKNNGGD